MKWATLDEWYSWWAIEDAKDAIETQYRERSWHYKAIPEKLYKRLQQAEAAMKKVQDEIKALP